VVSAVAVAVVSAVAVPSVVLVPASERGEGFRLSECLAVAVAPVLAVRSAVAVTVFRGDRGEGFHHSGSSVVARAPAASQVRTRFDTLPESIASFGAERTPTFIREHSNVGTNVGR